MAVATDAEAKKQSGDNRTMGRKATVPYGLYICHGFISANLAQQTGFSEEDLALFWEALKNMFDMDRSAARGLMSAQKLFSNMIPYWVMPLPTNYLIWLRWRRCAMEHHVHSVITMSR